MAKLPIVADRALLTDLYVRHDWQRAGTRKRAALWIHLVCGDWTMTRGGPGVTENVTEPVEQWEYVYAGTPVGCMN